MLWIRTWTNPWHSMAAAGQAGCGLRCPSLLSFLLARCHIMICNHLFKPSPCTNSSAVQGQVVLFALQETPLCSRHARVQHEVTQRYTVLMDCCYSSTHMVVHACTHAEQTTVHFGTFPAAHGTLAPSHRVACEAAQGSPCSSYNLVASSVGGTAMPTEMTTSASASRRTGSCLLLY